VNRRHCTKSRINAGLRESLYRLLLLLIQEVQESSGIVLLNWFASRISGRARACTKSLMFRVLLLALPGSTAIGNTVLDQNSETLLLG
jgi:hypothetical protein